jgi:hypothetical protein
MKLAPFESRWAEAAMQAIYPGSVDIGLTDIRAMNVAGFLCELMIHLPWKAALGLRLAVWVVALAPWFVLRRLATIAQLAPDDRERMVAILVSSPSYAIRSLVLILKAMGALLYAADDGVRTLMMPPRPSITPLRVRRVHAA